MTIEYRDEMELLQISYIFVTKVVGQPKKLALTEDEVADGFEIEWVNTDKIESILANTSPVDAGDNLYINLRDKGILQFFKEHSEKISDHG